MSEPAGGDRKASTLWRHRDFLRLWAAAAISGFGARITRDGLPIAAVLALGAEPAQVGILAALSRGPGFLVGLFAGGRIDRAPKRPVLVAADLVRAAMLAAVPFAALTHVLNLWWLYAAAAVVGAASAAFEMAHHAYLPSLIGKEDLIEGNTKLSVTDNVAEIGGPALAGGLFTLLTAPVALAVNAGTYALSAVFLFMIRGRHDTGSVDEAPPEHPFSDAIAGARAALGHPLVRPLVMMEVTMALFGSFFSALYSFFALRTLGLPPALLGLTISVGGVGAVIGALSVQTLVRRFGVGPAMTGCAVIGAGFNLFVPLAPVGAYGGAASLMVAQLFSDGLLTAAFILTGSLRQTVLPNSVLARVSGAVFVATGLVGIGGALLGGWLGGTVGARPVLWVATLGIWAATLFILFSPLRSLKAAPVAEDALTDPA